jgi:type VI secretion system protein ImpF
VSDFKRSPGHRTPLFDRLVDLDPRHPAESRPARILNEDEVRLSVARELERLCNTRSPASVDDIEQEGRHIANYGIPDLTRFSPASERDRERLGQIFARAIAAYEPRLKSPKVEVRRDPQRPLALTLNIRALLRLTHLWEPVSFPLTRDDADSPFITQEGT